MKNILIITFMLLGIISINAQTATDALRFSYLEVGGTARTVGIGGAIGALGADFSVVSTNPAGIGVFRTSEFIITPTLRLSQTKSLLLGDGNEEVKKTKANFNLNNFGVVFNSRPRGKFKTSNFAIGFNRLANFNQTLVFEGKSKGSYVDRFVELANGQSVDEFDQFEAALADTSLAIYEFPAGSLNYSNDFQPYPDLLVPKTQTVTTKGGISELVFSLGGNYAEKFTLGATIGVPFFRFEETKTYKENDEENEFPEFNNMTFTEVLKTSGVGINFKFGMIYNINKMFRVGAAIHTPTSISLTDNYSTSMDYNYTEVNGVETAGSAQSPEGVFDYKLRTPWRAIGSLAVLFKKFGFLSADLEFVDYTNASFNFTANSSSSEDESYEREVNDTISTNYTQAINLRFGGEVALKKLRFRAGYNISGTPYANDNITNNSYSLGIGLREQRFYIDLAFKHSSVEEVYIPYRMVEASDEQVVDTKNTNNKFMLTFGYKF